MTTWAWNDEADSEGVGHYAEANTDYNDATKIQQAYDYVNFSEITPTPVACWPLHEDSGTTANDLAGTNDGTINGATVGQAALLGTTGYSFDATDDYVEVPNSTAIDQTGSVTVSCWFRVDSLPFSDFNGLVTKASGVSAGQEQYVLLGLNNSDDIRWSVSDGSSSATVDLAANLTTNIWHNIVGVFDSNVPEARLYFNGSLDGSTTASFSALQSVTNPVHIGHFVTSPSRYWGGDIADTRIYDTALTASQVQTLYDVVATQGDWLGTGKTL